MLPVMVMFPIFYAVILKIAASQVSVSFDMGPTALQYNDLSDLQCFSDFEQSGYVHVIASFPVHPWPLRFTLEIYLSECMFQSVSFKPILFI